MERRTFTSNQKPLPNSPQNFLTETPPSHTRAWFVGAVFVILVILGIGIFLTMQREKQKVEEAEKLAAMTPTAMPTPTPASPSADFVFYKDLDGKEKFAVAYNFTDPILGASFAYPPGYTLQSLKAVEKDKTASIFFLDSSNRGQAQNIRSILSCLEGNRKVVSGMCREGYTDMEVLIQPFENTDGKYFETGNPQCREEINTVSRVLFSCLTTLSVDGKDTGMQYNLYLLGENPVKVQVTARHAKDQAHLIRSIISSATNKLN